MIEINPQKIDYTQRKSTEQKNPEKLVKNASSAGELIFRGGLALQAELGVQNVDRFKNFLTTPRGKTFLLQQTILQSQNKKSGTRIYNPAAPLIAKGLSQEFTSQKPQRHIDVGDGSLRGVFRGIVGRSIPRTIQENVVRLFDNKLNKEVNLQVRYGGVPGELSSFPGRTVEEGAAPPEDFIKFRIRDAVNGKYIIFPALLSNIADNSTAETTSFSYIGRADKVHIYGGYTRSISFQVDIVAQREEDIPIIWEKINYAKGLTLPQYKQFFSKTDVTDNTRPVAPIIYLTLGDMFNNAPGFFTSVNLSVRDDSAWELEDGLQMPHLCSLAFEFTYIGKENPTMQSNHYDNISKTFPSKNDNFLRNGKIDTESLTRRAISKFRRSNFKIIGGERRRQRRLDRGSFNEAFAKKRKELGPDKTFTWRGKQYNTNRADD
ncbi:MAG: hypothetical protein CBD63_01095 [Candidatus Pelagibacter sp. TMED203]|nr:MAG: hypothetical protein CBD63_01095 [Candidatus Pelagibacter sp. TMED203]